MTATDCSWNDYTLGQAMLDRERRLREAMEEAIKQGEINYHAKADSGKPKLSLVPMKIIFAIEKIRAYGNAKYPDGGKDNWKTVESDRHYEASLRHRAKAWNDPFAIDPESGLPHYFHALCDDAFFIEQNWDKFMEAIEKKSKPQSGYCNECKWFRDKQVCGRCRSKNLYAPKDEPQTMYYPQVDGITPSVITKTDPQTERSKK